MLPISISNVSINLDITKLGGRLLDIINTIGNSTAYNGYLNDSVLVGVTAANGSALIRYNVTYQMSYININNNNVSNINNNSMSNISNNNMSNINRNKNKISYIVFDIS